MKWVLITIAFFTCTAGKCQSTATNPQKNIKDLSNTKLAGSSTLSYKATALTTNFTVPLLRYNPLSSQGRQTEGRHGNVAFFNSIGAGIGITMGTLKVVTDEDSRVIDREMINTFGIQVGFLFASNSATGTNQNIFAPTLGFSILNFQLGYGYELGSRGQNEKKGFFTLAYGIPVSKLIKGGFYVLRRTENAVNENAAGFID